LNEKGPGFWNLALSRPKYSGLRPESKVKNRRASAFEEIWVVARENNHKARKNFLLKARWSDLNFLLIKNFRPPKIMRIGLNPHGQF